MDHGLLDDVLWLDTRDMVADPMTKEFAGGSRLEEVIGGDKYAIVEQQKMTPKEISADGEKAVNNKILWCCN